MMRGYYVLITAVILLEAYPDIGGWVAPIFAVIATAVTVYSQIKLKRLDTEIASAHLKNDAQAQVTEAWKAFSLNQGEELKDVRRRLALAEAHTRVCERGQVNLILQLAAAGVAIDFDKILGDMNTADIHAAENINIDVHLDKSTPPHMPHVPEPTK